MATIPQAPTKTTAQAAVSTVSLQPHDDAFAAMAARHARFLYRVAFTVLRNQQDAEDAVQESLLKLYRGTAWLAIEDEQAFLARVVWRVALDRLQTASARAMRQAKEITTMELQSPDQTPEQHALQSAQRSLVERLICALPEDLRRPLVLSAVEGMRSRDVAAILQIPEATVRTRALRARVELRRRYLATLHPIARTAEVHP